MPLPSVARRSHRPVVFPSRRMRRSYRSAAPELAPFMHGAGSSLSLPRNRACSRKHLGPHQMRQQDPRSAVRRVPVSPFSCRCRSLARRFRPLKPVCRRSRLFPPLLTEDDAKSALTTTSPFYFLEHAGGLNGSGMSPMAGPCGAVTNVPQYDPRSAAAVMPSSPFSLPDAGV